MRNFWREIKRQDGFTLTEVLVGMSVLTVAIVTGTSLLVGLIRSNENSIKSIQAYYLAQEGIEAVRNIRDSNWLHNRDWLSAEAGDLWGSSFEPGNTYAVHLQDMAWRVFPRETRPGESKLAVFTESVPWQVQPVGVNGSEGLIGRFEVGDEIYLSSKFGVDLESTGFRREVEILPYPDCGADDCEDFVLVRSNVYWNEGAQERDLAIESVLSDWKGGVL